MILLRRKLGKVANGFPLSHKVWGSSLLLHSTGRREDSGASLGDMTEVEEDSFFQLASKALAGQHGVTHPLFPSRSGKWGSPFGSMCSAFVSPLSSAGSGSRQTTNFG